MSHGNPCDGGGHGVIRLSEAERPTSDRSERRLMIVIKAAASDRIHRGVSGIGVLNRLLALRNGKLHNSVPSILTKGMSMKFIHMLSVGAATVGMTCLVGYASAANTAPGDLTSDSMLVAQGTAAPGGTGSGSAGGMGSGNTGAGTTSGSTNPGKGTGDTFPEKAKPGMGMDTGTGGNTGSNSGRTGTSSGSPGSSTGPTGGSGSSGMSGSGSGSSSGTGGGGK